MKKETRKKRKLLASIGNNHEKNTVFLEDFNMLDGYFWISLCDTLGNHIGTSFYKLEKGNNNVTDEEYNEALHHIRTYLKRANNLCHYGDKIETKISTNKDKKGRKSTSYYIEGYESIDAEKEKYGKLTGISVLMTIAFGIITAGLTSQIWILPFILTILSLISACFCYIHGENLNKKQNEVIELIHMNGSGISARLCDKRFSSLKITKVNLEETPFKGLKENQKTVISDESEKSMVTLSAIAKKTKTIEEVIDKLSKVKNKDLCIAQLKNALQYLNQYKDSFFQKAAIEILAENEYKNLAKKHKELEETLTQAGAKKLIKK